MNYKIKKGDRFLCIKEVVMIPTESIAYRKGEIYASETDGCITNDKGNKYHSWSDESELKIYFEKIEETQKGVKNDSDKLPYYTVLFKQFPLALKEVIKCSKAGNQKYHATDTDWQNFSRLENSDTRYKDAMLRHMSETGQVEDMMEYGEMTHEAAVVWNALADLEVKLRKINK